MGRVEQPFHKLIVWQKADLFVKLAYQQTRHFPSDEKYGITSQLRRAALSIVLNLVEGQARGSSKDFVRFLKMARGSCSECAYLLEICEYLGYTDTQTSEKLQNLLREVNYLLQRLMMSYGV